MTNTEWVKLEDCKGGVLAASGDYIRFKSGQRLSKGQIVELPAAAGGGSGEIDEITMIWGLDGDNLTFSVRVVDALDRGHQFHFSEAEGEQG